MLVSQLFHQGYRTHDHQPIAIMGQSRQLCSATLVRTKERQLFVRASDGSAIAADEQPADCDLLGKRFAEKCETKRDREGNTQFIHGGHHRYRSELQRAVVTECELSRETEQA